MLGSNLTIGGYNWRILSCVFLGGYHGVVLDSMTACSGLSCFLPGISLTLIGQEKKDSGFSYDGQE